MTPLSGTVHGSEPRPIHHLDHLQPTTMRLCRVDERPGRSRMAESARLQHDPEVLNLS